MYKAMLAVGLSFPYIVFSLFSMYRGWIMRDVDEYKQLHMAMNEMMWSTFYNFFVITVLWAGHSTKNEV